MTKKKDTRLARHEDSIFSEDKALTRHASRAELVRSLDEELKVPGGKDAATRAILAAARALAPIFSVMSHKDPRAADERRMLGKRLVLDKPVVLGGGLTATLVQAWSPTASSIVGKRGKEWSVRIKLRTRGSEDMMMIPVLLWRESVAIAIQDTEAVLTRLASALRQAGAS